ncbi:V-type proton ATPase subunit S1-like [Babylonia areolata]|uniref:V-type proton ATPase subunit S1-like n=1 Tax=Babylonia areolata TaxID=304850 RepID=UPI003FD2D170
MAVTLCMLVLVAVSAAFASDVPVLMWSPERPLSDLPQVPAFDQISQDTFQSKYLSRLLGKESSVIVAFLQDKLTINDISKYADVYNPTSDGGAFKNVKGLLDEHFSLELPRVGGSYLALDALRRDFPGAVHDVASASDLSGLDLGKGNHLVVVRLLPIAGSENAEGAISSNDDVIGEVSRQLQKMNVKYTALYTAETSQERQKRETHQTRQLMEKPEDASKDGIFFNVTSLNNTVYAYLTSFSACIVPGFNSDNQPTSCQVQFKLLANDTQLEESEMVLQVGPNRTLSVTLSIKDIKVNGTDTYSVDLELPFEHQFDRWEIKEAKLSINSSGAGEMVKDAVMVTRGYDSVMSLLYSFHCSSMEWYPKNTSEPMVATIILGGFQVQPFNVQGGKFLLSQDCVGWFSTAIWMALFPTAIHIAILLFGMYMIMSLSTNDRFDDPKGKALIINAGE